MNDRKIMQLQLRQVLHLPVILKLKRDADKRYTWIYVRSAQGLRRIAWISENIFGTAYVGHIKNQKATRIILRYADTKLKDRGKTVPKLAHNIA